jgi:CheY-like chemotaxis protein
VSQDPGVRKILIVPDPLAIELGTSFLDRRSFAIRVASHAESAIGFAVTWCPNLILFSSQLPGLSAVEFCRQIRANEQLASVRLVMLTDQLTGAPLDDLIHAKCDAHLIQPVAEEDLLHTIGALLNVRVRRGRRVAVELLARVHEGAPDAPGPIVLANILSLGETGLLLEAERHLTIGAIDRVSFSLPSGGEPVCVSGLVLVADELQLRYAMEFVSNDDGVLEQIREFVTSHPAARASTQG